MGVRLSPATMTTCIVTKITFSRPTGLRLPSGVVVGVEAVPGVVVGNIETGPSSPANAEHASPTVAPEMTRKPMVW